MRKFFICLLAVIMIISASTVSFAASPYHITIDKIDKPVYRPGTHMIIQVDAATDELFTIEILKDTKTMMSMPASGPNAILEIMIPLSWGDGSYVLRAGRGTEYASVNFEINAHPADGTYLLTLDKTTVRVGDTLILTGTSTIANSAAVYCITPSHNSPLLKFGDVTIRDNRFECFVPITSDYTVGSYSVNVGSNDLFSNTCSFAVESTPKVESVVASQPSSSVSAGTKITLSTPTENAAIYYTLDGTTPTSSSTLYTSSGITINSTTTLKAIAIRARYENSDILTKTYTVAGNVVGGGGGIVLPANTTPKNPFGDVAGTDWFCEHVTYVNENGLMKGISTEPMLFDPSGTLTRGMVVTVLYRMAGSPNVSGIGNTFDDLTGGNFYTDAVKWAAANGIVKGYGSGKFGPNDNVTREQLAAIIYEYERFSGKIPTNTLQAGAFVDQDKINTWAKTAANELAAQGIISGKPGGVFDPGGTATRAEFAAVLHRFQEAEMS